MAPNDSTKINDLMMRMMTSFRYLIRRRMRAGKLWGAPPMTIVRFLRKSPVQTFLLVPLTTLAWEWAMGTLHVELYFLPLMIWGYLQYRLCGRYRIRLGAGGPGLSGAPPERLVDTGIY